MKPGGQKRRRWRIIRRLVFVFFVGLLALWGTLNLFFSISWGTSLISDRLEKRIGLPCSLESVTWTPWKGVAVKDLVVSPHRESGVHGELLRIDLIVIDPSWLSMAQGKKRFERMEVTGVRGKVTLEFIKSLMGRDRPAEIQEDSKEEGIPEPVTDSPPLATTPDKDQDTSASPESKKGKKSPETPQMQPVDDFEGVVIFRDVDLTLTSSQHPGFSIALESPQGEIPLWGREREGVLKIAALHVGGEMINRDEEIPLYWKEQYLRVDRHKIKLAGLEMNFSMAMRLTQGLPIGIQVEAPKQEVDFSSIFKKGKSPVSIGQVAVKGQVQGYLVMPQSFAGYAGVGFVDLQIQDSNDGSALEFYRGFGEGRFSRSGLVVSDARAIGDEEAVLFNGFVTSHGEAAATVRLVGSPGRAEVYENRVHRINEQWTFDFQPLVTEDRLYRDLRLELSPEGLTMDLGEGRSKVPFLSTVKAILAGQNPRTPLL